MSNFVVAIPKSGNNLAHKACQMLGIPVEHYRHTANWHLADEHKIVYIYRNPRNVLVSCVKYTNDQVRGRTKEITEERLIDTFFDFFNCSLSAVERAYLPWMDSNVCKVEFEDLAFGTKGFNQIADYYGVERREPIGLYGSSPTWSGGLSDWEKHWGEKIEHIWIEEGMPEIEKKLGYDNKWPAI